MPIAATGLSRILPKALRAEGIDLNPHYRYVVAEWTQQPYLADDFATPGGIGRIAVFAFTSTKITVRKKLQT